MAVPRRPSTPADVAPVITDDWRDMIHPRADPCRMARSLVGYGRFPAIENPQMELPGPPELTGAGAVDLDAVDAWLRELDALLGGKFRRWCWDSELRYLLDRYGR